MANLSHAEKMFLEKIFNMSTGYVLGFNNSSFAGLFWDEFRINIDEERFRNYGTSKANRMRSFWAQATDKGVAKFLNYLFTNWDIYNKDETNDKLPSKAFEIVYRLDPSLRTSTSVISPAYGVITLNELDNKFLELHAMSNPQARGFAFEKFLNHLFECFNLEPRSSFKLVGEQIDGSFMCNDNTYLVEAKWQDLPIGNSELLSLFGKVDGKTKWARGLYISLSGFSKDGLEAFAKGRSTNMVGMNGQDLHLILQGEISLPEAIRLKTRKAAEEGSFFVPIFDLSRRI